MNKTQTKQMPFLRSLRMFALDEIQRWRTYGAEICAVFPMALSSAGDLSLWVVAQDGNGGERSAIQTLREIRGCRVNAPASGVRVAIAPLPGGR